MTEVPASRTRTWWIAVLFMVGSLCFALGAVPAYVSLVGAAADGMTFFVGSIFFTSAATLQFLDDRNAANGIQLVGTVFFNVSTFRAMAETLGNDSVEGVVWRPDAFGSVCFLVASWLAYAAVGPRRLSWRPSDRGWWVAALNLIGSILFGLSAIGAYVVPATGELLSTAVANGGTFLGALGFLVGAALLLPPSAPSGG